MAKKHHVMSHQSGYRAVVHDLHGKSVRKGPWVVTHTYGPIIFEHEEPGETPQEESTEEQTGQS